jgi:glyoxylase-like metal-dependent hydrolase (beta-lactamase superfamily II)
MEEFYLKSDWFDIKKVTDNVYRISDNDYSNNYLITGTKKSLLVDTGWGLSNIKKFAEKYTDKPIEMVNTHGHPDHIGGNSDFDEFYISKYDVDIVKRCYRNNNKKWAIENVIKKRPENFSLSKWMESKINKIIPIDNGHKFNLGDRVIEVINIPGHSKGCIALLDNVSRCIFCGDSIFNGVWLHLDESETIGVYKESLQKIKEKEFDFDYILPGHGEKYLKKSLLKNLINLSNDIYKKTVVGKKIKTMVGEGMQYCNDSCKIIGKIV